MLIHVIVTLMLQKNKRPTGARLQKSPGRMTGRLLRLWVWEPLPTKQKAKRIYAAPACDLASGGLFALLATITLPLFSGSCLSYNEGVIGLTTPCMSFHARSRKL